MDKNKIDIFTVLGFAEWLNINGIRCGESEWKYRYDNYKKVYSTSQMYKFYKENNNS